MESFHQFWDKINGKMYKNIPPPAKYNFANYTDGLTTSPLNGCEGESSYTLRPISDEDMASYARDDVEEWYRKYGTNTTKLGPEMTDAEFKRFYGHTW
jgi:hypothetical protein